MATVATVFQMEPTYNPFERPPDPVALWTTIPRGLRGFIVENGTLDAKPDSDTQTLTMLGTLPAGFGYVFGEIALRVTQNTAANWTRTFTLNLQNYYQGHAISMSFNYAFDTIALPGGAELAMDHQSNDLVPKAVMWAPGGAGIEIQIFCFNSNSTVSAAGTVSCYINFWEFDLEQIRKFPINTPQPVHLR